MGWNWFLWARHRDSFRDNEGVQYRGAPVGVGQDELTR